MKNIPQRTFIENAFRLAMLFQNHEYYTKESCDFFFFFQQSTE